MTKSVPTSDIRSQFITLRHALAMTQTDAAEHIAEVTMRPCALRSVQSWEADPKLSSSRGCPDWALKALQTAVKGKQKS